MIGSELAYKLMREGYNVCGISRNLEPARRKVQGPVAWYSWDGESEFPAEALDGVDSVVHLAGEGIVSKRWTSKFKDKLRSSRVTYGQKLCAAIKKHRPSLKAFIGGSALGYYGDCGDDKITEDRPSSDKLFVKSFFGLALFWVTAMVFFSAYSHFFNTVLQETCLLENSG